MALIVLPTVLIANLLCMAWPSPPNPDVTLRQTVMFLRGHTRHDSWGPMRAALDQFNAHPDQPLYERLFFDQKVKFQYPPSALLPLKALATFGSPALISDRALNAVSFMAIWLTAFLCARILLRSDPAAVRGRLDARWTMLMAVVLALLFFPLVKAFTLGQIQAWINGLFAGALYAWMNGRTATSGVLVGLICLFKPQLVLLLAWGAVRRQWRFVAGAAAVIATLGGLSLAIFGWRVHVDYLTVLRFIGQRGEVFLANQSVNGVLNRWVADGKEIVWNASAFAPYVPLVHRGTLITSALLIGWCLFWRRREHAAAPGIDLGLAALTFTMASPVGWDHHYGILAPIFALAFPLFRRFQPLGRATQPLLLAAFVVAGSTIAATTLLAGSALNVLQSYLFFAAVLVLVMLYQLRTVIARRATDAALSTDEARVNVAA